MEDIKNQTEPTEVSENVETEVYYKEMSPIMMVMRRFFRSRLSVVGVVLLLALLQLTCQKVKIAFAGTPDLQHTSSSFRHMGNT